MMGGDKLIEEELVKDVTTPNLPDSWIKPFKLSGADQYDNTKITINMLEVLEQELSRYLRLMKTAKIE